MTDLHTDNINGRHKYFLAGFLANAIWGFMALPLRRVVDWSPFMVLYGRTIIATLFLCSLLVAFRISHLKKDINLFQSQSAKQRRRVLGLIGISSFLIVSNWFSYIYVVNRVSVSAAALAYLICPLLTTLAAFFILKEKISAIKWCAIAIALCSVFILGQASLTEVLWAIGVAIFYAFYLIIQRLLPPIDKLNLLAVQLIIGFLLMLPFFLFDVAPLPVSFDFWVTISVIAIFFTVLPLFLSLFALNRLNSSTLGMLIYINPIISFIIAVLYFQEALELKQIMAYTLLFIAVFLYNIEILRQFFVKFVVKEFDNR